MFKFIKRTFVSTMMIFNNISGVNSLESVSISNQEGKVRPKLLMLIVMSLYFILSVLKQVSVLVVVTI